MRYNIYIRGPMPRPTVQIFYNYRKARDVLYVEMPIFGVVCISRSQPADSRH